jgi:tetratricopeptide (TPR) repeat protein
MPTVLQNSSQPFLSLCMIVKNEADNLPRCLSSAKPYVDEIIVVDTGSTDQSVAIAHQFGAKVSYFAWCDDFAAARNASLALATGEWILVLDADEELEVKHPNFRQQLRGKPNIWQYNLTRFEVSAESVLTEFWLNRLFRNLPQMKYVDRFHEQLTCNALTQGGVENLTGVTILHYGYAPELKLKKLRDRNIPILKSMRQKGQLSLMLLISLADMYETTGDHDQSKSCYSEAFEHILPSLLARECPSETGYLRFLLYKLTWQMLESEDYETARLLLHNGLNWFPSYPPLAYLAGLMLCYLEFFRGAIPYFQTCLQLRENHTYDQAEPFDRAYLTSHPAFSLGRCWMELERWQEAEAAFQLALKFDPDYARAQERLAEINGLLSTST